MAFPASVPSLPAAFVLIPVAAPFRPMSETLKIGHQFIRTSGRVGGT